MTQNLNKTVPLEANDLADHFIGIRRSEDGHKEVCQVLVLHGGLAERQDIADQFVSKASALRALAHNNLSKLYDIYHRDSFSAVTLEYTDGIDLRSLQKRSEATKIAISIPMATFIATELAKALTYLHSTTAISGVNRAAVYSGLCQTSTIYISTLGDVKISGYPTGCIIPSVLNAFPGRVIAKSRRYIAPEVLAGGPASAASDIYSLGVILWELLCLYGFTSGVSKHSSLEQMNKFPTELAQIVDSCTLEDPTLRLKSASDLELRLGNFLRAHYPRFAQRQLGSYISEFFDKEIKQQQSIIQEAMISDVALPSAAAFNAGLESKMLAGPAGGSPASTSTLPQADQLGVAEKPMYRHGKTLSLEAEEFSEDIKLRENPKQRGDVRWDEIVPSLPQRRASAPTQRPSSRNGTRSKTGAASFARPQSNTHMIAIVIVAAIVIAAVLLFL